MKQLKISILLATLFTATGIYAGETIKQDKISSGVNLVAEKNASPSGTPKVINPYTGATSAVENKRLLADDINNDAKIAEAKAKLKKNEIDLLKYEQEYERLKKGPEKPVVSKPSSMMGDPVSTVKKNKKKNKKESEPVVDVKPEIKTPTVSVISPRPQPVDNLNVLGILNKDGSKTAIVSHQGRTIEVGEGSFVNGKQITKINDDSVRYDNSNIRVFSPSSIPRVELNDTEKPSDKKNAGQPPQKIQPVQSVPSQSIAPQQPTGTVMPTKLPIAPPPVISPNR